MKKFALLLFVALSGIFPATAQDIDHDSFELGVEAFNAGNCKEALRIMRKYEKEQPSAAYVVRICELMEPEEDNEGISYDIFMRDLKKGDLSRLDRIGMVERFSKEISGFSGAMYVQSLRENAKKNPESAFQMGLLYQEGIGVKRNFKRAADFFSAASEKGHANASNSLGMYYRFGIGVKKNAKKAEELYKKAILNGNSYAFYNLGQMYADQEDFLQAWILADLGVRRINPQTEKKKHFRIDSLLKKTKKNLSSFQRAYLEKFRPYWLKPVMTKQEKKNLAIIKELPIAPKKMIEETPFMTFIRKDAFDNKYKTFYPLMPYWVAFDSNSADNPDLTGKKAPAPFPEESDTLAALYFRPADPRHIRLTLRKKESAIPVMVGDVLTVYVYTPLYENNTTRKGGHMYLKNTGYKINLYNPNNVLTAAASIALTPLSEQTARNESWLSKRFYVRKEGTALIRFTERETPDGKVIFPHTLKIIATKGKPPK